MPDPSAERRSCHLSLSPWRRGPETYAPATPGRRRTPSAACGSTASSRTYAGAWWAREAEGNILLQGCSSRSVSACESGGWSPPAFGGAKRRPGSGCSAGPPGRLQGLELWRRGCTELWTVRPASSCGPGAQGNPGTKCRGASRWLHPGRANHVRLIPCIRSVLTSHSSVCNSPARPTPSLLHQLQQ